MNNLVSQFRQFMLDNMPWAENGLVRELVLLAAIALCAVITYYISKWVLYGLSIIVEKTSIKWDDILINHHLLNAVAQLAPALTVNSMLPAMLDVTSPFHYWIKLLTSLYVLVAVIRILTILVDNAYYTFLALPKLHGYAIKGIFQMVKLVIMGIGIIVGLSILLSREPAAIVTAIGASAAILMLVFKDTILGLVASVQLSANKMLQRGDWIVCDSHGVNGEVEDVSLTTIKIRNWDNSISTIPPYTLISDSFRNYQEMRKLGGRRVDRSILIDINTIRLLSNDEIEGLRKLGFLDNLELPHPTQVINLQLMRLFLERHISSDPRVNKEMLVMVREMEPTANGLPVQLYFFTNEVAWKEFELIQSDIFDHVYAIVNRFGLRIFQAPAGTDLARVK